MSHESYDDNKSIDVLIIGGGLSGLTSAYKIKEKEKYLNVVILEANSIIGGQLNSSEHGELGAKFITENQYHIYDLLKKFDIKMNTLTSPLNTFSIENIIENELIKTENWLKLKLINLEIKLLLNHIDIKCMSYNPGRFKILEKDQTMEKFISHNLIFEQSREILRLFIRLIAGTTSKNIKLSVFLSICNSADGFHKLINLYTKSNGSLENVIEFSSKELLENFQCHLKDVKILTNTKIIDIFHYPDYVLVRDIDGNIFYTSILVIAIPLNSVQKLNILPKIPKEILTPISYTKYYITSFIAAYSENQPWKNSNFCGNFIDLEQPIIIGYPLESTKYTGILLHNYLENDSISKDLILKVLSKKFGKKMLEPNDFIHKTFEQNLLLNLPITTPLNRVIFSSTTTATVYRGYLSGAVQSGYRAAINALQTIRPQNISWQDINQIKKAEPLCRRVTWWKIFITRINLYHCGILSLSAGIFLIFTATKIYIHFRNY